ncbi:unnamed protein product [Euphydryas editha]|uniref:glutathione transferase n=1 Tax=Euphydryas editha TaxID=104508 RepID=A0AAU9V169_EUPED|nr:unnamed protein product [Euphydryas editha]
MLTLHHLNQSRSHRVIWALEELPLPYEIVHYQREKTMLAPESLKKVHPLGKSQVLEDNGLILAESGAILEYLQETYDPGSRLKPLDPADKMQYRFWLHYAEALGQGVQKAYLNRQIETHARFIESHLSQNSLFAGESLSMADIQMSFPIFALLARGGIDNLPHTQAWKEKVESSPGWQRTLEQGGPLSIPVEDKV